MQSSHCQHASQVRKFAKKVTPERSEPARLPAAFHPPPPRQHPASTTSTCAVSGVQALDGPTIRSNHPGASTSRWKAFSSRSGRTTLAWRSRTYNCATSTPAGVVHREGQRDVLAAVDRHTRLRQRQVAVGEGRVVRIQPPGIDNIVKPVKSG